MGREGKPLFFQQSKARLKWVVKNTIPKCMKEAGHDHLFLSGVGSQSEQLSLAKQIFGFNPVKNTYLTGGTKWGNGVSKENSYSTLDQLQTMTKQEKLSSDSRGSWGHWSFHSWTMLWFGCGTSPQKFMCWRLCSPVQQCSEVGLLGSGWITRDLTSSRD